MRISEQWLRNWVSIEADTQTLADQLTMAGLEVDAIEPAAPDLTGVVIGQVTDCQPHPDADKLQVCQVDLGTGQSQQIVCGAANVAVGIRAPVATVGTCLPSGLQIKAAKLRGVDSHGMLCSASELGLGLDSDGLWLLPDDAPPGQALGEYLATDDTILELDLTPDRGDCLSIRGVAREAAVAFDVTLQPPELACPAADLETSTSIDLQADDLCTAYAIRHVHDINPRAQAPIWLKERLRRAGIRSISLPVDIGNYVMLEIGQPMHAFDADKIEGNLCVRRAQAGETIVTLDNQEVELLANTLVIADDRGPVAMAGMIGGARTAVDNDTRNILFEAACFTPAAVAGQGRRYKIHTDSLHRFERGVDPEIHQWALQRASALLMQVADGQCSAIHSQSGQPLWPRQRQIDLHAEQITRLLGQTLAADFIPGALTALGAKCQSVAPGHWRVKPPSWRFDLNIEADLIEEIARIYGYDRLAGEASSVVLPAMQPGTSLVETTPATDILRMRGYHEAITYSFVDPALHAQLTDNAATLVLDNPIAEQMQTMRTTLWAGLLDAWTYNSRRQQPDMRLFEHGLRFLPDANSEHGVAQIDTLAGLIAGQAQAPHWDTASRHVDFFDLKGDVEALISAAGNTARFQAEQHPALHPGRSARILIHDHPVGWIGQLAPGFARRYKTQNLPYLFEIDWAALQPLTAPRYQGPSDQPRVTRDLALVVPEDVQVGTLITSLERLEEPLLQSIQIFDIFRGQELEQGQKSVALSLIFQDKESTLADETVDQIINKAIQTLQQQCDAKLRGE